MHVNDLPLHCLLIYVQIKQAGVTFHTAKDLQSRVEMLLTIPEWKFKVVSLTGHTTKEPTLLFYHDSLDCVEYLFGNPTFANWIDFSPTQLYCNLEQTICMYTEWMTGNSAWEMQVQHLYPPFDFTMFLYFP